MTTKITITAEIHDQRKVARVVVSTHGTPHPEILLKPGESTEQYVWGGQTIAIEEIDAPLEQGPADADPAEGG